MAAHMTNVSRSTKSCLADELHMKSKVDSKTKLERGLLFYVNRFLWPIGIVASFLMFAECVLSGNLPWAVMLGVILYLMTSLWPDIRDGRH